MNCIGNCRQGRDPCDTPELCGQHGAVERVLVVSIAVLSSAIVIYILSIMFQWVFP